MNENRKIEKEQENKKHQKYKRIFFATFLLFILVFICACKNKYGNEEQKNIGLKPNLQSKEIIGKGKWYVLPAKMDRPRFSGSADLLPDGRVLILGNTSSENNSAQIFDPNTGEITTINPPIYNRAIGFATTPLKDGRIYISGGDLYNKNAWASEMTNTAEIYDPLTNKFTEVTGMKYRKYRHKAILLKNGNVLILHNTAIKPINGNFDAFHNATEIKSTLKQEVYNPYTNEYYDTKNSLLSIFNHGSAIQYENGDLLIIRGYVTKTINVPKSEKGNGHYESYVYKLDENKFVSGPELEISQDDIFVQIDSNNILVIKYCSNKLNSFLYKINENQKIPIKNFMQRAYCGAMSVNTTVMDNKNVLITGMGINPDDYKGKGEFKKFKYTSYIYDFQNNEFVEINSPPYKVFEPSIVKLKNGDILYVGGKYDGKYSDKLQLYRYK